MPYRDRTNAMSARRGEIQREIEDIKARVGDFEYLKWRQKELEAELANLGMSTHLPNARARIETWLANGLVVLVLGTAVLAVVAMRVRAASSETARVRLPGNGALALSSSNMPSFGPVSTANTPNLQPMLTAGPTPHLTRTMPPPTRPPPDRGGIAIDYVKGF